jgi:hypothetical protein
LFDAYRAAGIANAWTRAREAGLGSYLDQILSRQLSNRYGTPIDLNLVELGGLPKDIAAQLQAINPDAFTQLHQLQVPLVQNQMATAYGIVFAFCASAYVVTWAVMKLLVPRFKKIENI